MRSVALPASVLLAASSCAPAARPVAPVEAAGIAAHQVAEWRRWPRANPARFRSKGHGYVWVDVHVPPEQREAYDADAPPPVGFRVVMAGYDAENGGEPHGLTVMAKMPPGYDPDNGDWYYGVMAADGRRVTVEGKLEPCIGCHRNVPTPRDHLFGLAGAGAPE